MKYYTRSQAGLPPLAYPLATGCRKEFFIIHMTASSNGVKSLNQEFDLVRMWDREHRQKYGAACILEGMNVFQSGDIIEGRMPLDSNNGAAYGAARPGFGIEVDGTFLRGFTIPSGQYGALVELCVWARKQIYIPLDFRGHNQLGAYDKRNATTDCPGNLLSILPQLKRDVAAGGIGVEEPKGTEEVEDMYFKLSENQVARGSGYQSEKAGKHFYIDIMNDNGKSPSKAVCHVATDQQEYGNESLATLNKESSILRINVGDMNKEFGPVVARVQCTAGKVLVKFAE